MNEDELITREFQLQDKEAELLRRWESKVVESLQSFETQRHLEFLLEEHASRLMNVQGRKEAIRVIVQYLAAPQIMIPD